MKVALGWLQMRSESPKQNGQALSQQIVTQERHARASGADYSRLGFKVS
jgi:hypothetical protein